MDSLVACRVAAIVMLMTEALPSALAQESPAAPAPSASPAGAQPR
jgi:hypothetical protein